MHSIHFTDQNPRFWHCVFEKITQIYIQHRIYLYGKYGETEIDGGFHRASIAPFGPFVLSGGCVCSGGGGWGGKERSHTSVHKTAKRGVQKTAWCVDSRSIERTESRGRKPSHYRKCRRPHRQTHAQGAAATRCYSQVLTSSSSSSSVWCPRRPLVTSGRNRRKGLLHETVAVATVSPSKQLQLKQ